MKVFEQQYKSALVEIEKIINVTDNKVLLKQLKKDREYILNYLYSEPNNYFKKTYFDFGITDTKEEISDFIISNQLYFFPLTNLFFLNKNSKQIEQLFNNFIEEDVFGLKSVYKEIISNNRLTYTEESNYCWGRNTFIPSIKRNFIEIRKSKRLYEATSKVHELGHSKTNIECLGIKNVSFNLKDNSFLESYSIFLELVFADYLKNNGKKRQGYELKFLIFQSIKDISEQLYEELDQYKEYDDVKSGLKFFFEMNYKTLKGYYLSLYFYYLYQSNPKEALGIINNFIKEIKLLDDSEVIQKFNFIKNCFRNDNVYKLYRDLKQEKKKIKSK